MGRATILVADDAADIRDRTGFALAAEGFRVFTAADGLQALRSARELEPDLIVLDETMPKANGYRVCQMLINDQRKGRASKTIPIILLTARKVAGEPERENAFMGSSNASHMMYKPFEMHDLVKRIGRLLGR